MKDILARRNEVGNMDYMVEKFDLKKVLERDVKVCFLSDLGRVMDYSTHTKTWCFPSARLLEMDQSQRSNTTLLRCDWSISSNRALGKRQVFVCVL